MPALRHRLTKPGTAAPPDGSVELTCARDGLTHRVDEPAYAAGLAGHRGTFRAVCGAVVLAGSLVTPPGRRCPTCVDVVQLRKDTARRPFARTGQVADDGDSLTGQTATVARRGAPAPER